MTRYEQGFLTKCAELGVKQADARVLLRNYAPYALSGAAIGGGIGALTGKNKKNRIRNAIIGAGAGGLYGGGLRYVLAGSDISALNNTVNNAKRLENALKNTHNDTASQIWDEVANEYRYGGLSNMYRGRKIPFLGLDRMSRIDLENDGNHFKGRAELAISDGWSK